MINANMRIYNYFTLGARDEYGQPKVSDTPAGTVKMAISVTSQNIQDNILYSNATYMGLTHDKSITDKFIIQYGDTKLKVLYVSAQGRLRAVFMTKVD